MFERKRVIALTDRQQRVMVRGLTDARNGAIRAGQAHGGFGRGDLDGD